MAKNINPRQLSIIPATLSKEQVLALDIATHCGFFSLKSGGTWNFTEGRANNWKQHQSFRKTLIDYITTNDIKFIVAEDFIANARFAKSCQLLGEFRGILMEVCDELDMYTPAFLTATEIKKFATGNGNADKTMMKEAMKTKYGLAPVDDNHADACHVFHLFCHKYNIR